MTFGDYFGYSGLELERLRDLAQAAYANQGQPANEVSLGPTDLGLPSSQFDDHYWYNGEEAHANVTVNENTLTLAFRGTDKIPGDLQDYPGLLVEPLENTTAYIWQFEPLLNAVADYVSDPANGIENVDVTGHSLGAAAVNQLRDVTWNSSEYDDAFDGATYAAYASPNIENDSGPIFNIGHSNDQVFRSIENYSDGNETAMDNVLYFEGHFGRGIAAHDLDKYGATLDRLNDALVLDDFQDLDEDTNVLVDGSKYTVTPAETHKPHALLGQPDSSDVIKGGSADDVIIGGGGWDLVTGGEGDDTFGILNESQIENGPVGATTITDFEAGDAIQLPFGGFSTSGISEGDGFDVGMYEIEISKANGKTELFMNDGGSEPLHVVLEGDYAVDGFQAMGDTITYDPMLV